ncbi:endo-1,4-beta-xylanase 5 isoform X2 [Ziziphus jujuba]|nr:endo-1,4-beta-xylanase 5 isoform X2 [Ziziphus jujuba]
MLYDSSAYTECQARPEAPLYHGGVLKNQALVQPRGRIATTNSALYTPALMLHNLTGGTVYCFSSWVKIKGADSSLIRASLAGEDLHECVGSVIAKRGCWSFLKGGFVISSSSNFSLLYFHYQNAEEKDISIEIASASLQPFTSQQWEKNRQLRINAERKRVVTLHVSDKQGDRVEGALVQVQQISKDFPLGSAIASTVLGNQPYQNWFVKRFNAAVFENELKWNATEHEPGKVNYTIPDQMLEFVRANQIISRGHNIFWENPKFAPPWVRNLSDHDLESAINFRIQSLMKNYKDEFINWDVNNEMLHFDFYEQRLGPNASLRLFEMAHQSDPLATLFMNEFNVVETCADYHSTVDAYISRLRELKLNGVSMGGIGLQGHFTRPNPPLIRAVLDKLATLHLPIWLTEVDVNKKFDMETQALYLEEVLREGFSHPSVNGIMLWTAHHPNGCYQMCLTDNDFHNLPAGDVVDKLLMEWQTGEIEGLTDERGSYSFNGFLGEYKVSVKYGNQTASSTFSLNRGGETRHFSIQL